MLDGEGDAEVERVLRDLVPKLLELAQLAMANQMALTVDSEEADRLMQVAPYLVRFQPDSALLERLLGEGWGRRWATFLTRSAANG